MKTRGRPPTTRDAVAAILGRRDGRWLSVSDLARAIYTHDGPAEHQAVHSALRRLRVSGVRVECVRVYRLVGEAAP